MEPGLQVERTSAAENGNTRPRRPMRSESHFRFVALALALLTVAATVLAFINYQKERSAETPTDGVWWVEQEGWLRA